MTQSRYQAQKDALASSLMLGFADEVDGNKSAVVALFPLAWRWVVGKILWPFLLKIGSVIAVPLTRRVMTWLSGITIGEIVDMIQRFKAEEGERRRESKPEQ